MKLHARCWLIRCRPAESESFGYPPHPSSAPTTFAARITATIRQGEVYCLHFGPAEGRPALVVQHDRFNRSAIATTVVAAITSKPATGSHARQCEVEARRGRTLTSERRERLSTSHYRPFASRRARWDAWSSQAARSSRRTRATPG